MLTFTFLFALIGLLSAGPQYYRASPYSLKPFVNLGRNYGRYQGGYRRAHYGYAAPAVRYFISPYNNYNVDLITQRRNLASNLNIITNTKSLAYNVNIVTQTRSLADSVRTTLRQLAADPNSALIVDRIIRENYSSCITSLEEGIASIETATAQLERAGPEVRALVTKVKAFVDLTQPEEFVRNAAEILRLLGPLVTRFRPVNPNSCRASPRSSLGELLNELSNSPQLFLSPQGRAQLKQSASIISAVTSFLTQLRSTLTRFENICTADKQGTLDYINAMGDIMVNLADLFDSVGGSAMTGENLRKGQAFVAQITVSYRFKECYTMIEPLRSKLSAIQHFLFIDAQKVFSSIMFFPQAELSKIDNLGLGDLDCNSPGDLTKAANTLEEVATLIDEIGLENLQQQLGINLPFSP